MEKRENETKKNDITNVSQEKKTLVFGMINLISFLVMVGIFFWKKYKPIKNEILCWVIFGIAVAAVVVLHVLKKKAKDSKKGRNIWLVFHGIINAVCFAAANILALRMCHKIQLFYALSTSFETNYVTCMVNMVKLVICAAFSIGLVIMGFNMFDTKVKSSK